MRETTTYIKLDRNILDWGWYQDSNTFRVFVHLLLKAQIKDEMYMGVKIKRGDAVVSYGSISKSLGITYDQARTAIQHLQNTNEITIKRKQKFLVVSIVSYNRYQDKPQSKNARKNIPITNPQQSQSKNIRQTLEGQGLQDMDFESNPNQIPITNPNKSQHLKNIKKDSSMRFPNGETLEERKKRLEELRNQ